MSEEKKPTQIFIIPAQPQEIDAALVALAPSEEVEYIEEHAGYRSSGRHRADQLAGYIGDIINRQAKGFYTLREAAQAIADANRLDSTALLQKFKEEFNAGILTVRNPGTQAPHEHGATLRDFSDWVTPQDIDEVLSLWRVPYRFPATYKSSENAVHLKVAPPPKSATHRVETRTNALTAVISKAKETALCPDDAHSIWAAFVALAESPNRPNPLLGHIESEGVKFQNEGNVAFITKKNFLRRIQRKRTAKNR